MSGKRRYSLGKDSTKKCTVCGQFKNVAEFSWANKKLGYKQPSCRSCKKILYQDLVEQRKEKIVSYLKTHPCVDCGFSDYRALDFDHVRGEKLYTISKMWAIPGTQKHRDRLIDAEIAKCDVRCRNCHSIRHAEDGWGGGRKITDKDAVEYYDLTQNEEYEEPSPQLSFLDMLG